MPKDYISNDDDLQIADGDFVVGESTSQHFSRLLRLKKGELRQFPKTGVDFDRFILDDNAGDAYNEIQKQFEADGIRIRRIELRISQTEQNKLEPIIEAYYE